MLQRTSLLALLAILATTGVGLAAFAQQTVPLAVPATVTVTGADAHALLASPLPLPTWAPYPTIQPIATAAPTAAASAAPIAIGNTDLVDKLITRVLGEAWSGVKGAADSSQIIGVRIYTLLAVISFALAFVPLALGSDDTGRIRFAVERIVETSLWVAIISNTWSGLGWFPLIISSAAKLGSAISGLQLTYKVDSGFTALPGTLLDMGGQLFGSIIGTTIMAPHGILNFVVNAANGQIIVQSIIGVLGLCSAFWVFFAFAYAAFKLLMTILKTYLFATLSLLQGLAGSHRLSGYAGGFFSGALVLGIEIFLTMAICGLFAKTMAFEQSFFQAAYQANSPVQACGHFFNDPSQILPCIGSLTGITTSAINMGALAAVDASAFFFLWALRDVPKLASDVISARFTMSGQEAIAAMKGSPSLVMQGAGWAAGTVEKGASSGVGGFASEALAPAKKLAEKAVQLGATVAIGAATGGVGLAGTATAAGTGFLMGGGEGAMAAGFGKMVFGDAVKGAVAQGNPTDGGEFAGSAPPGSSDEQEASSGVKTGGASDGGRRQKAATDASADSANDVDGGADAASRNQDAHATRRTSVDGSVSQMSDADIPQENIADTEQTVKRKVSVEAELSQEIGKLTSAINAMNQRAPQASDGSVRGTAQGGSQGGNDGGFVGAVAQFGQHQSLGQMFLQRAMYQSARTPTPPPPPKEESGTMNFNLVK